MSSRLIALILAAVAAGCGGGDFTSPAGPLPGPGPGGADPGIPPSPDPGTPAPSPDIRGRPVFAVDLANRLMLFGSESPDVVARIAPITGLGADHRIVSVDFRGENGLYGVGTDSRLYAIDALSGVATPVGSPFRPEISGTHFGILIDGETNQIRIHGAESGQNLLLRAGTGELLSVDAPLAFAGFASTRGRIPGWGVRRSVPRMAESSASKPARTSWSASQAPRPARCTRWARSAPHAVRRFRHRRGRVGLCGADAAGRVEAARDRP